MPEQNYRPVACDFHDRIEALATLRRHVHISHETDASGADAQALAEGVIVDIFTTSGKEEFLRLDDDTTIRLDRIVELRPADPGA